MLPALASRRRRACRATQCRHQRGADRRILRRHAKTDQHVCSIVEAANGAAIGLYAATGFKRQFAGTIMTAPL